MVLRALAVVQATDADVLVKDKAGIFGGFAGIAVADATVKVYDAATVATAANTNMIASTVSDLDVDGGHLAIHCTEPIRFNLGLVIVVTGAGTIGTIWYK